MIRLYEGCELRMLLCFNEVKNAISALKDETLRYEAWLEGIRLAMGDVHARCDQLENQVRLLTKQVEFLTKKLQCVTERLQLEMQEKDFSTSSAAQSSANRHRMF
jgi:archaellum component FlaC